jgi:hypothetical protein
MFDSLRDGFRNLLAGTGLSNPFLQLLPVGLCLLSRTLLSCQYGSCFLSFGSQLIPL